MAVKVTCEKRKSRTGQVMCGGNTIASCSHRVLVAQIQGTLFSVDSMQNILTKFDETFKYCLLRN
jgi:hypothetical protein